MIATLPIALTPELRTRIACTAREWIGTPFVPHARIKGAGVDCVNLPAAILIEAGVIESTLKDPTYRNLLTHHFRPRWASVPPTI